MDPLSLLVLVLLGGVAGAINAAVGSGSLLTLPVLLALGVPPGTAVRTNTIGMAFSTIGSVIGFRREIAAEGRALRPLLVVSTLMAVAGSLLLLTASGDTLEVVVPILIVVALVLVLTQKRLTAALARRAERRAAARADRPDPSGHRAGPVARSPYRSPVLLGAMGAASLYGGFFTAAQGILYLGILGTLTGRTLKAVNPVKNLASLVVNLAAALVYLLAHVLVGAGIVWAAVGAIAVGSLLGGYFGAHLARRLPDGVLRGVIVVVALVALVRQVL